MLEPVFIQQIDGKLPTQNHYLACEGFDRMGHEIVEFERTTEGLALPGDAIVVAGVAELNRVFKRLDISYQDLEAIPDELIPFAGRRLWTSTIGAILADMTQDDFEPVFIKPLAHERKLFPGIILDGSYTAREIFHLDEGIGCVCGEVVDFRSEWRVFVHHRQAVNISNYAGDPLLFPDVSVIEQMLEAYSRQPVAFSLDVGVIDPGKTLPVEVNDSISLGAYGMRPVPYAKMILDRWRELRR